MTDAGSEFQTDGAAHRKKDKKKQNFRIVTLVRNCSH